MTTLIWTYQDLQDPVGCGCITTMALMTYGADRKIVILINMLTQRNLPRYGILVNPIHPELNQQTTYETISGLTLKYFALVSMVCHTLKVLMT